MLAVCCRGQPRQRFTPFHWHGTRARRGSHLFNITSPPAASLSSIEELLKGPGDRYDRRGKMESMLSNQRCRIFKVLDLYVLNMYHKLMWVPWEQPQHKRQVQIVFKSPTSHPDRVRASINNSAGVQQQVVVGLSWRNKKVYTNVRHSEPRLSPAEPVWSSEWCAVIYAERDRRDHKRSAVRPTFGRLERAAHCQV